MVGVKSPSRANVEHPIDGHLNHLTLPLFDGDGIERGGEQDRGSIRSETLAEVFAQREFWRVLSLFPQVKSLLDPFNPKYLLRGPQLPGDSVNLVGSAHRGVLVWDQLFVLDSENMKLLWHCGADDKLSCSRLRVDGEGVDIFLRSYKSFQEYLARIGVTEDSALQWMRSETLATPRAQSRVPRGATMTDVLYASNILQETIRAQTGSWFTAAREGMNFLTSLGLCQAPTERDVLKEILRKAPLSEYVATVLDRHGGTASDALRAELPGGAGFAQFVKDLGLGAKYSDTSRTALIEPVRNGVRLYYNHIFLRTAESAHDGVRPRTPSEFMRWFIPPRAPTRKPRR